MKANLFIALFFFLSSCSKDQNSIQISVTGTIHPPGVTAYQYGTHELTNSTGYYALKSQTVNLDTCLNQTVTIYGVKIAGYPIDGGPEFINVTSVVK